MAISLNLCCEIPLGDCTDAIERETFEAMKQDDNLYRDPEVFDMLDMSTIQLPHGEIAIRRLY